MKKIVLLIIFLFSFTSAIAYAGEGVVDGIWVGEGAHADFELLLREHTPKVFGSILVKIRNSRKWDSHQIIHGDWIRKEIILVIITRGCDGSDGGGTVTINGAVNEDTIKATLTQNPSCSKKKEEIIFHKE